MSASTQEIIQTLLADYFGLADDPRIGWIGVNPSHPDLFKCERCGHEHKDCFEIVHAPYCPANALRKFLMRGEA